MKKSIISFLAIFTFVLKNMIASPPVELIEFDARLKPDHIDVLWATASEVNSKSFVVDFRSPELYYDGHFIQVLWSTMHEIMLDGFIIKKRVINDSGQDRDFEVYVPAECGINFQKSYQLNDSLVKFGDLIEYSIYAKPINLDSDSLLFKDSIDIFVDDAEIINNDNNIYLSCSPNPFGSPARINYFLPKSGYVRIMLSGMNDDFIKTIDEGFREKGEQQVNLIIPGLSTGFYLLLVKTGNEVISKKLINLI